MNSARLHKKLKEDTWFKRVLSYAEEKPNISGTAAILVFVLLAHFGTTVISGFIGFLYPAYKTLSLFHHPYDLECGQKWMIYWFLYSALHFIEMICLFSLDRIPTYWILKCFFLVWCYAPPLQTNGADFFCLYMIRPFFQNQKAITNAISHVIRTAHCVYSKSAPLAFDGIHTDSRAILRSCPLIEDEGQELRPPENEGSSSFVYENDSSSGQNEGWIFFPEIEDIICEPDSDGGQDDPVDELSESEVSNVVRIGGATNDAAAIAASDYVWF